MSIRLVGRPRFGTVVEQPDVDFASDPFVSSVTALEGSKHRLALPVAVLLHRLRVFELVTATLHLVQAIVLAILVVTKRTSLASPVDIPYVVWPARNATGAARVYSYPKPYYVGTLRLQWMIFAFFMLSWFFQTLAVSPLFYRTFKRLLVEHYAQPLRWC
jgi:hypothetical protein